MAKFSQYPAPHVAIPARAEVGEGPAFDPRTGKFIWIDITKGDFFETDLASTTTIAVHIDTMLGAAVPRSARPGFAVAVSDGYGFLVDGKLELVAADFPSEGHRSNDAKCDSRGRLWAGSNAMDFTPGAGFLRCWTGGATAEIVKDGLTLPNGLGWNADDTEMYLVDSMERRIYVAPFNAETGELGELDVLKEFDESDGLPDGMAVDIDGNLWVAMWGGSKVLQVNRAGSIVGEVAMPVAQPSSCAFDANGVLYITSATAGLTPTDGSLDGSVFALQTETRGVPVASFAG